MGYSDYTDFYNIQDDSVSNEETPKENVSFYSSYEAPVDYYTEEVPEAIIEEAPIVEIETIEIEEAPVENFSYDEPVDFYDSLAEFVEEPEEAPIEISKDVYIPIYKKEADEVIVTPDGKTLNEMLQHISSGGRKNFSNAKKLIEEHRPVKVGKTTHHNEKYITHLQKSKEEEDALRKKIAEQSKLSQSFGTMTPGERHLYKNLGISGSDFKELVTTGVVDRKTASEIVNKSVARRNHVYKNRFYKFPERDINVLEFIAKFQVANVRTLRWVNNESMNTVSARMKKLQVSGLAKSFPVVALPDMWRLTSVGIAMSGYTHLNPHGAKITGHKIAQITPVNYIAACLWSHAFNVLDLDDFPTNNRLRSIDSNFNSAETYVRGETLISEYEIRSSLGKIASDGGMMTAGAYARTAQDARDLISSWDGEGNGPEFENENEYLFILYPDDNGLQLTFHIPDLVLRRPRVDGSPESIAVEVEMSVKDVASYKKTMLAYKLDTHLYKKVIWVTQSKTIYKRLMKAIEEVGLERERYEIVPLLTKDGPFKGRHVSYI